MSPKTKGPTDPCKVDDQGRTIIPKEIRVALGLTGKGHVTYEVEGNQVRLRAVQWVAK